MLRAIQQALELRAAMWPHAPIRCMSALETQTEPSVDRWKRMFDSHRCEPAQHDRGGLTLGLSFIHENASGQMATLLHVRLWVGTRRDTLVPKSLSCNAQILCIENRGRDCGSKVLSRFEQISQTIKRYHRSPRQGVRVQMGDQGTTRGAGLGRACMLSPDGVRWVRAKFIVLPPRNSAAAGGALGGVHPMPSV